MTKKSKKSEVDHRPKKKQNLPYLGAYLYLSHTFTVLRLKIQFVLQRLKTLKHGDSIFPPNLNHLLVSFFSPSSLIRRRSFSNSLFLPSILNSCTENSTFHLLSTKP